MPPTITKLERYAVTCQDCGLGQAGDRGFDKDELRREQHEDAGKTAFAAGQAWNGKTVIEVPAGQALTSCPNCHGEK